MKKRFFYAASMVCAAAITALGFGSCKTGKLAARERAALQVKADSLSARIHQLESQIGDLHARMIDARNNAHLLMYGGPNMSRREREDMERAVRLKEQQAFTVAEKIKEEIAGKESERTATERQLNEVMNRLDGKK